MTQTIDLRKKPVPKPKIAEPKVEIKPTAVAPQPNPVVTPPPAVASDTPEQKPLWISWETGFSQAPPKHTAWYIFGFLTLTAATVGYFRHDLLFSIILILVGSVVLLRAYAKPHDIPITIDIAGVSIGKEKYYYYDLKSFWLDYSSAGIKELSLEFRKTYQPPIRIPLETANPLKIRELMVQYIPEKEHERSILDHVSRLIGF